MVSVTKFAGTVSQSTGGKFVTWSDLGNIRNNATGSWAVSSVLIQGKSESKNRPSTITGTNFGFNLPQGAEPTKVIVSYRHHKSAGNDWTSKNKRIMNIPAPTISLVGVSGFSGKGVAPIQAEMVTSTKTFNVKGKLSRSQINSKNFGFKLDYPANSNAWDGYMQVSYVKVTVEYVRSEYSFSVKKVSGGYNKEDYTIQLSISNKNMTSFKPTLTLSSPVGFSFKRVESVTGVPTSGTITQNSARSFTWNPELSSKVGTSSINLVFTPDVTYPSGQSSYSGTFTLSESLYSTSKDFVAVITERPPSEQEETVDPQPIIDEDNSETAVRDWQRAKTNEEITYAMIEAFQVFAFPIGDDGEIVLTQNDSSFLFQNPFAGGSYTPATTYINSDYLSMYLNSGYDVITGQWNPYCGKCGVVGRYVLKLFHNSNSLFWSVAKDMVPDYEYYVEIIPEEENLSVPNFSLLEPSEEELDRLGTEYTYVVQSNMKQTTTDSFSRNWYKNNRIGVFNNPISDNITITTEEIDGEIVETITDSTDYDNLTDEEIFTYAEYWSTNTGGLNEYDNVECEFTYNSDYPLYILFTGDYNEATTYGYDKGTITYTEPNIIEKTVYNGMEANGNYPTPIINLITEDNVAETQIPTLDTTNPVILYDYPLDEDYGTNDEISIRGIEVTGTIAQSDELVLTGKLINPNGITGERTTIINNTDTQPDNDSTFKLGGLGDLWGFKTQDITNLEDWELQITINNILLEDIANINLGDINLTIYTEKLDKQNINIKVDGEDLSYYGAFIEEVNIPEGLETDTDFLTIDGTDTNDAYRQNIREKEIELTLSLGECDLQTSTDMLRQLAKVLVNEKDSYNRPIPKRIEFSHYPDVYFEYIMKEAFEVTNETTYYDIKAKLTIPAGTAYSKEVSTTNITGFVQGLAAVSPLISFKPQSNVIEINELVSSQRFSMGYDGDWQSKIVELDCANRIAYLKTNEDDTQPIDISKYVDFNSDWFSLHGEYSFSGTNCVIRRVEFQERW